MQRADVMLVGSANMDLVIHVPRFPAPGETLTGQSFQTFPGGKGANQAVACGKLGGTCGLVARVGADGFGEQLIGSLSSAGVDTSSVFRDTVEPTGTALITIDAAGQNTIVVAPGSNGALSPLDISKGLSGKSFKALLVQLEIPMETVVEASKNASDAIFILNPAPARELPFEVLARVDYLTPNETEAELLTGIRPTDDASCLTSAAVLFDKGVKNVLFTLGERGSFLATPSGGRHFPSIPVTPVDTTAAGDAFNGAFALFLAQERDIDQAIRLANIAGAISTTKAGAQTSMPSFDEVLARFDV